MGRERVKTLVEKVASKFLIDDGCWEWIGANNAAGYGMMKIDGRTVYGHRAVYELLVDEIPAGMQLDHLCRNRMCVRPSHLEVVTNQENAIRGHRVTKPNFPCCGRPRFGPDADVYIDKRGCGYRVCRPCHLAKDKAKRRERRSR